MLVEFTNVCPDRCISRYALGERSPKEKIKGKLSHSLIGRHIHRIFKIEVTLPATAYARGTLHILLSTAPAD